MIVKSCSIPANDSRLRPLAWNRIRQKLWQSKRIQILLKHTDWGWIIDGHWKSILERNQLHKNKHDVAVTARKPQNVWSVSAKSFPKRQFGTIRQCCPKHLKMRTCCRRDGKHILLNIIWCEIAEVPDGRFWRELCF